MSADVISKYVPMLDEVDRREADYRSGVRPLIQDRQFYDLCLLTLVASRNRDPDLLDYRRLDPHLRDLVNYRPERWHPVSPKALIWECSLVLW